MNVFEIIGIVLVVIGLLCLILPVFFDNYYEDAIGICAIICLSFITLAGGLFIGGTLKRYYRDNYETCVYDIISLERDIGIKGSFVLGNGHIENNQCYYFYINTDKGYKLKNLSTAKNVYIVETNDKKPSVWKKKEKKQKLYYIIYVPTGTIIKEFKG